VSWFNSPFSPTVSSVVFPTLNSSNADSSVVLFLMRYPYSRRKPLTQNLENPPCCIPQAPPGSTPPQNSGYVRKIHCNSNKPFALDRGSIAAVSSFAQHVPILHSPPPRFAVGQTGPPKMARSPRTPLTIYPRSVERIFKSALLARFEGSTVVADWRLIDPLPDALPT
jgi:hypothetical protein